jgi:hypothetical protein
LFCIQNVAERIRGGSIIRLLAVLDTQDVAAAMTRLKAGFGLKVMK